MGILGRMTWSERTSPITAGDRVAYSARFLRSIGCFTGDMPQVRGTVTALEQLGDASLAIIDWGGLDLPQKVHVANLSRVTEKGVLDRD
jgi:hypothetical protein